MFTLAASLGTAAVFCDESPRTAGEEDEDPYDNLPEEDEETDCTMCQTFRQGPCRDPWRKLERCFKENNESTAGNCTKYFMGHQECLSKYLNLYQLVSLGLKQEIVRDTQLAITDAGEKFTMDTEQVDWNPWKSFGKDAGPSFCQTVDCDDNIERPLWKRFPDHFEPVLVATDARLPTTLVVDQEKDMVLKYAYALDQDGYAVGFMFHDYFGYLADKSTAASEKNSEDKSEKPDSSLSKTEEDEPSPVLAPEFTLEFHIVPGETRTVQLFAFYQENPVEADPAKKLLDVRLGSSRVYDLGAIQ